MTARAILGNRHNWRPLLGQQKQSQPEGWQGFQQFLTMLMQGQHYYQMEQRYFCRVCNQQNERAAQRDLFASA
ncbi:hypothetical protein ABVB26_03170 [Vibrio cholerae]